MADAAPQSDEKPAEPTKANQPRSAPARKGFPPRKPRFKGEMEDLNGNVFARGIQESSAVQENYGSIAKILQ